MSKVHEDDYGGDPFPALQAGDLPSDRVKVTILEADPHVDFGEGKAACVLVYREFPDKKHRINKTGVKHLIRGIGDESEDWLGRKIMIEKIKTTDARTREAVVSVWVSPSDDWPATRSATRSKKGKGKK